MAYLKYLKVQLLVFIISIFMSSDSLCQCTNTILNPMTNVEASAFNDAVVISTTSNAGEYFIIEKLSLGGTYIFSSSNVTDYITIRDKDGLVLLDHGPTPLSYTINGADIVSVHINLATPPYGAEQVERTTYVVCTTCPPLPLKVELGSLVEVSGIITIGDVAVPPEAGMIRWNDLNNDFEGYDGEKWRSLTRKKAWGAASILERNENQKVISSGGNSNDEFGISVAISGGYAIVGAYKEDGFGGILDKGATYIYVRNANTWILQQKIQDHLGAAGDLFGSSVSISGDYAIVGAENDKIGANSHQGSAYIFVRNGSTWTQQAKLTASVGSNFDYFGSSVSISISGDYAIVGAMEDGIGDSGSAYIFVRNGSIWTQQAKLTASDADHGEGFGISASISGDYAIVGAFSDDVGTNTDQGSAYIFVRNGSIWTQQAKLTASDGSGGDWFGYSVSISGAHAIVGAFLDDVGSNDNQGSAYIFVRNGSTWTQQAKLTASDGSASDYFGRSVSISENHTIVGTYFDDVGGNTNQGSAYIFVRNGSIWTQQSKLTASDGNQFAYFGVSVSISGDYAVIGALGDDVGANTDQGSAYFFNK